MITAADVSRSLLPGHGPLLCAADPGDLATRRRLERAWVQGVLVRLVPRVYLCASDWAALPPWDRSAVAAAALALVRPHTVFTGLTAARLLGLPVAVEPPSLEVRATSPGHRGTVPLTPRPFAPVLLEDRRALPLPPRRRARWGLPRASGSDPVEAEVRLSDGTAVGRARADQGATLLAVLGAHTAFRDAVAPLDALVRSCGRRHEELTRAAEELVVARAARRRLHRVCSFADGRAESAGESYSRAIIRELGFAAPTSLQQRHVDGTGAEVARTDFWWAQAQVAGEFDGLGKYDLPLHGGDDAARRAGIRREKEREVSLQLLTRGVAHWTWADLRAPERLARILSAAGVPRAVSSDPDARGPATPPRG